MNRIDLDIDRALAELPDLIPRDKVAALIRVMVVGVTPSVTASLSEARAFGRREALEEAARECEALGAFGEKRPCNEALQCADRIRALAEKEDT